MTRVTHDYKIAYETNSNIYLEKLFNQLGSVFQQEVESPEDDWLQAAKMAQAQIQPKPVHQDRGNYSGSKKQQDTRPSNHESPRIDKLMHVMYN
jgi:hypothetical protein